MAIRTASPVPDAAISPNVYPRIFVLALAVALWTCGAQAAASEDTILVPARISEHVWFFQGNTGIASRANKGFMSNAGFVVTSDGVVVFDALGTPALGRAMVAAIAKVTPQPIRRVIVSHYHADHVYGLQAFQSIGAEIWAQRKAELYLASDLAATRLAQRRVLLSPWVDDATNIIGPNVWLEGDTDFRLGGLRFRLLYSGGAHSPEDVMMFIVDDRVLFAGDLLFSGRIPYVGTADSRGWQKAMSVMIELHPAIVLPGHGPPSTDVERDLGTTRDYLLYLRQTMGRAVREFEPFEDAYAKTDWSRFSALPAFADANRINANGTYLLMEQEELQGIKETPTP